MPQYLNVDGHQVYSYEWDNNGEAVLLLHGGLSQTSHWDQYILPAIEDQFHVFGYDRTAHGFTGACTLTIKLRKQLHILKAL
jgi:pimeloyl-ACP methyl ester carboxylesterase